MAAGTRTVTRGHGGSVGWGVSELFPDEEQASVAEATEKWARKDAFEPATAAGNNGAADEGRAQRSTTTIPQAARGYGAGLGRPGSVRNTSQPAVPKPRASIARSIMSYFGGQWTERKPAQEPAKSKAATDWKYHTPGSR